MKSGTRSHTLPGEAVLGLGRRVAPSVRRLTQIRNLWHASGLPALRETCFRTPTAVSFDIFETLATVAIAPSSAIWTELGRRITETTGLPPGDFAAARFRAIETVAAQGAPTTLELVYNELGSEFGLDDETTRELALAELRLIDELLGPIDHGRCVLEQTRQRTDHPITFISDMHLPSSFLRAQLRKHQLWREGDELWVSGETGARKVDGKLFELVSSYGMHSRNGPLLHIGDDLIGDVVAARWAGWSAKHARWGLPTVYEELLTKSAGTKGGSVVAAVAGVARQQRLASPVREEVAKALQTVANGVAAPFMSMYALWLLHQADKRAMERLYFVSRDGEILAKVTRLLARALNIDVGIHYLYGGRAVWQQAAMGLPDSDALIIGVARQELLRYGDIATSVVASRFGLNPSIIHEKIGLLAERDPEQALGKQERELALAFLSSQAGCDRIRSATTSLLSDTIDYLAQEGLLRDDRWALVDVGWRGNTVEALNSLLQFAGGKPARAFFVGYLKDSGEPPFHYDAYLWDARRSTLPNAPPPGAVSVVEAFCSGTEGSVAGFERSHDGEITPVLHRRTSAAEDEWHIADFHRVIEAYVARLASLAHAGWLEDDTAAVSAVLLEHFTQKATRQDSQFLGSCPREEDAQGALVRPLARPFSTNDLMLLARPQRTAVARNLAWPHGSLALTPAPQRYAFRAAISLMQKYSRMKSRSTDLSARAGRPSGSSPGTTEGRYVSPRRLLELLSEDYRTHGNAPTSPGFQALAIHRLGQFAQQIRPPFGPLLRILLRMGYIFIRNVYGIELPPQALIGRRVKISHQSGIVISGDAVIGDDCRLRQNVTIGSRGKSHQKSGRRKPVLERGVYVGTGATILGGVTIGSEARIGANALVVEDVPPGARVYAPLAAIVAPGEGQD